ncbi:MAG: respiratory nitrate reductase subunit gamma [Thermodesulfobacteriota bacterium]
MSYLLFGVLPYFAAALFLGGLAARVSEWRRTPVPLWLALPPVPPSKSAAARRLVVDALLFRPLRKRDFLLWLGAVLFHYSLLLALLGHLRFFVYPVPIWISLLQYPAAAASLVLPASLFLLFFRRLVINRLISTWTDYLPLGLILASVLTGLALKYLARENLVEVKAMTLGLVLIRPYLPRDLSWLFYLHFLLALTLMAYCPFSKLIHGLGLFFSPLNHQADDPGRRRHVNPWDAEEPADWPLSRTMEEEPGRTIRAGTRASNQG